MNHPSKPKKPYRKPTLKVHGDIRKLTGAKAGTKTDGPGKPRTKLSGGNA
jgi:hypothetical protein